ncbi:MAG: hypothetical protein ACN6NY_01325 [Acinetobacter faecalis]|uniref:hypothetical protein n=1 Tax=Acinetobacter faecalis TaxID=2665161 RepID=UPI002A90D1E6|nr:hypothetical protein [Acinetobacter faecalis]MDY6509617.1 hypothetical protein [Acinetobacter faecalis]
MLIQNKLKVAVCFFGHLRSYTQCAPFFNANFFKYHDCDLFMHTWSTLDHSTQTWHNLKATNGEICRDSIINAYTDFKEIKIEKQIPKDFGVINIQRNNSDSKSQMAIFGIDAVLYSMRESFKLCENYMLKNEVNYDFILFIRPDIWLKTPLKLLDLLGDVSSENVAKGFFTFGSPIGGVTDLSFSNMRAVDLCFFAKPSVIKETIENNSLIVDRLTPNMVINYCPEVNLINLVREKGFKPYRIESYRELINWEILRAKSAMKFYKKILKVHIKKDKILLRILPYMMISIINIRVNLFKSFTVAISFGHNNDQIN